MITLYEEHNPGTECNAFENVCQVTHWERGCMTPSSLDMLCLACVLGAQLIEGAVSTQEATTTTINLEGHTHVQIITTHPVKDASKAHSLPGKTRVKY